MISNKIINKFQFKKIFFTSSEKCCVVEPVITVQICKIYYEERKFFYNAPKNSIFKSLKKKKNECQHSKDTNFSYNKV